MKRMIQRLIVVAPMLLGLAVITATSAQASGPGFNCAKATRQIDKAICSWDTVSDLDSRMAATYTTAMAAQDGEAAMASVKAGQRAWLAERDQRCGLNTVTPREGSEEGLSPKALGQLMCLQAIYPPRIARLMDIAAPPLVPRDIKMLPIAPLAAAYPDDWQQANYQAQLSPGNTLMALGVEDGAGYVKQVWLYQPASGRLVLASPRTSDGDTKTASDITELRPWFWGTDGRFYLRASRRAAQYSVFGADMQGYAEQQSLPADVASQLDEYEQARKAAVVDGVAPMENPPPGYDDDSYDDQEGGAFTAWAQNKGHGSFELRAVRDGDTEPRIIASGGWELRDFLLDPQGRYLLYNGEDGLVATDPETGVTRRLKGTRGTLNETRPINMSANGNIVIYSASGACMRDAADEIDSDAEDLTDKRVCLAYLQADDAAPVTSIAPARDKPLSQEAASAADPWVGKWEGSGEGTLSATIRRGTAKPDYLVVDLYTGAPGCSGAVTLFGKPTGATLLGESYDPTGAAPVCRVALSLDDKGRLKTEVAGSCSYYHGGSCGFDGSLKRGE